MGKRPPDTLRGLEPEWHTSGFGDPNFRAPNLFNVTSKLTQLNRTLWYPNPLFNQISFITLYIHVYNIWLYYVRIKRTVYIFSIALAVVTLTCCTGDQRWKQYQKMHDWCQLDYWPYRATGSVHIYQRSYLIASYKNVNHVDFTNIIKFLIHFYSNSSIS
jgi:hypothetical protein